MVGVFGAFAICGVTKNEGTAGDTVLDYFADDWMVVLVQVFEIVNEKIGTVILLTHFRFSSSSIHHSSSIL